MVKAPSVSCYSHIYLVDGAPQIIQEIVKTNRLMASLRNLQKARDKAVANPRNRGNFGEHRKERAYPFGVSPVIAKALMGQDLAVAKVSHERTRR